jgi:flavorubredoxin
MEDKKMNMNISNSVIYIGVDDKDIDLFESQYAVPEGVSYNSYVIIDEKIAVMDTADQRVTKKWFKNLENVLDGKSPDYLIVSHLEPDHAGNIQKTAEKYPNMKIVVNAKSAAMLPQFADVSADRLYTVKEGDELVLGQHTLQFFMAPMVHWPEVMVEYEKSEKILFSADGFGKFGTLDTDDDWTAEARRYYFNIVGKYGGPVQTLLKKASALDIKTICPLHGPVLRDNLSYYIEKYALWSSYKPEEKGILIAFASIHGNTGKAAYKLKEILEAKGETDVVIRDLARDDMSETVSLAFKYDRMILAAASYDAGVFPCMEDFLHHLRAKSYQKRTVAIMENGSWAPTAARTIKAILEPMKDITLKEPVVTIKSVMKATDIPQMEKLADEMLNIAE